MSSNEPSDLLQKPPEASRAIVCQQPGPGDLGKDVRVLQRGTRTALSNANAGESQGPSPLHTTLQ